MIPPKSWSAYNARRLTGVLLACIGGIAWAASPSRAEPVVTTYKPLAVTHEQTMDPASWQEGFAPLINGDAGMYLMGNFIVGEIVQAGLDRSKLGYFQFPVIDGNVRTAEDAPTNSMHIPAKAKNKTDARKLLAFISRPDINEMIATADSSLSTNNQASIPDDEFLKVQNDVLWTRQANKGHHSGRFR